MLTTYPVLQENIIIEEQ